MHFSSLPSDYTFTKSANILGDIITPFDEIDSDANIVTGATGLVDVLSGDINLSLDAGLYRPATIEGFLWHDLNANGIHELEEPPFEGIVIALYNDVYEYIDIGVTNCSCKYVVGGLLPDTYYAKYLPTNYYLSPTDQGSSDELDSDFLPGINVGIVGEAPYYPDW